MNEIKGVFSISYGDPEHIVVIDDHKQPVCLNDEEQEFIDMVFSFLASRVDLSNLRLDKRSDNYTSLIYGEYNDFLRFRLSARTKWLSLRLPSDIKASNMDNSLFDAQKNKKQLHWKAKLNSLKDVAIFKDFIIASCI